MSGNLRQELKTEGRLFLLPKMQKGLAFLELPLLELATLIHEEMIENPFLECEEASDDEGIRLLDSFDHRPSCCHRSENPDNNTILENSVAYQNSLFDSLMDQAHERLSHENLKLAAAIIGHLEESGLLLTPLEEIAHFAGCEKKDLLPILTLIQSFDPPGIGATSLQEALLIQLKRKKSENSLGFRIIEKCFPELLQGKIGEIAKKLRRSGAEIEEELFSHLSHLNWHPGKALPRGHYSEAPPPVIPDLFIKLIGETLAIIVNDEKLPKIRFNHSLLHHLSKEALPKETARFLHEKINNGKWLVRHLFDREKTLSRIGEKLIEYQKDFFLNPQGKLQPWTMKELAQELSLHESTIARAVSDKYVSTPRGLLPLRSFFTHCVENSEGEEISVSEIKKIVQEIIKNENPRTPLSDEEISSLLRNRGFSTARRTVAKYRTLLGIPPSSWRKRH